MKTTSPLRRPMTRRQFPYLGDLRTLIARVTAPALSAALMAVGAASAHAADAPPPAKAPSSPLLLQKDLTGIPNKEGIMLQVQYAPGGTSLPHRHDAHVFVYVLEGTVKMQVDGQPEVTLTAGQTFYETPSAVHRVSANASATQPAKLLVFMVKDKDKPATKAVSGN
jgi:quercetin dioxygenase-like cupin family protein